MEQTAAIVPIAARYATNLGTYGASSVCAASAAHQDTRQPNMIKRDAANAAARPTKALCASRVLSTGAPIAKALSNRRATTGTITLECKPRYATNAVKPAQTGPQREQMPHSSLQCMWQGTSAAELPGWHVAALVNAFDSAINERLPGRSSSQLALTGAVARRARLHRHPHDHTGLRSEVKRRSHGDVTSFGGRLGRTTRRHGTLPVTDPQRMCRGA